MPEVADNAVQPAASDANQTLAPIVDPVTSAPGVGLSDDPHRRDTFDDNLLDLLTVGAAKTNVPPPGTVVYDESARAPAGEPRPGQRPQAPPPPADPSVYVDPKAAAPGQDPAQAPDPNATPAPPDPMEGFSDPQYELLMKALEGQSQSNLNQMTGGASPQAPQVDPAAGMVAPPQPASPQAQPAAMFPAQPAAAPGYPYPPPQAAPQTVQIDVPAMQITDSDFEALTMSKEGAQKFAQQIAEHGARSGFEAALRVMDPIVSARIAHMMDAHENSKMIFDAVPGMKNYPNQVKEAVLMVRQQNPGATMEEVREIIKGQFAFANDRYTRIVAAKNVDVIPDRNQRGQFAPAGQNGTRAPQGAIPNQKPTVPANSPFNEDTMSAFADIVGLEKRTRS